MEKDLEHAGWALDPDSGFVGHVGGIWRRELDGQTQLAFIARDIHANRIGVVHGGMLMTFTDRALGMTVRLTTGAVRGATVSLTHQFLAPVRLGEFVEISPQVTKATSRLVFMSGTAFVGDAPVIAVQGVRRVSFSLP